MTLELCIVFVISSYFDWNIYCLSPGVKKETIIWVLFFDKEKRLSNRFFKSWIVIQSKKRNCLFFFLDCLFLATEQDQNKNFFHYEKLNVSEGGQLC